MPETTAETPRSAEEPPSEPLIPRILAIALNASTLKAVRLILLASAYSPVSQLCLSPVYGSVPSGMYHRRGMMAVLLFTWLARGQLKKTFPSLTIKLVPAFVFWIPTLQYFLFQQSRLFGLPYGPVITESLTYFPLLLLTIYAAGTYLDQLDLSSFVPLISEHGPAVGSYVLFTTAQKLFSGLMQTNIGGHILYTRAGYQLTLATLYALTIPSTLLWPAIPSIAFNLAYNPHIPLQRTTDLLNSTLQNQNFTLLERTESLTGYISVLENTQANFRVMRCDHSLLGGEWTKVANYKNPHSRVKEPVYAVFAMLEAVRLVERDNGEARPLDSESTALNMYVL